MENISKITIDDSCTSMYFSFNSTSANKTVEAMESAIADDTENEQNLTLEADENNDAPEHVQTVKKLSFGVSPLKAIPKNIMQAYKTLSSTPTKAQLLRSVEVTRGSGAVDVCDLGLAFLEAPQESINVVLSEDKENQPQESQEIYSETSSEIVVSVIEKTQEEVQPVAKKVGFSNLPVLKTSNNTNIRGTPKPSRASAKCVPDLNTNRPSRIASKRFSLHSKIQPASSKEFGEDDVPKMINSMLKISGALSTKGKPSSNPEKAFSLLGKATRMSILKTTLNSPARKVARKSINSVQAGRNPVRQSVGPVNKRVTMVPNMANNPRRSVIPSTSRRSVMPTTVQSPTRRQLSTNSRKSIVPVKTKTISNIPNSRKSMAAKTVTTSMIPTPTELQSKPPKPKSGAPNDSKEELTCDVCNRKFRVHSLFESHKKSHITSGASSKQTFSTNDKQCRYCDKKFAIAKALTNHLLEKCTKIPPGDKKKLLFPSDQPHAADTTKQRTQIFKNPINLSSCDSLSSNSTQSTANQLDGNVHSMLPPSVNKIKKKLPHSAFAEHTLTHSTSPDDGAAPAISESTQTEIELKNDSTQTLENEGVEPK